MDEWQKGGGKTLPYSINDGIRGLNLEANPHLMVKAEGFRDCVLVAGSSGNGPEGQKLSVLHVSSRVLDPIHGHGGDFLFTEKLRNNDLQGELGKTIEVLLSGDELPEEIHFVVVGGSPLLVEDIKKRLADIFRKKTDLSTTPPTLFIEEKRLEPKADERKFGIKNFFVAPTKIFYFEGNQSGELILKSLDY